MFIACCAGHTEDWVYRVGQGEDAGCLDCEHDCCFYASDTELPGTVPISIGSAGEGDTWRHNVLEGEDAGINGWNHEFTIYVFQNQLPGTIPYAIGHYDMGDSGWKYRFSENCEDAGDNGWEHDFVFYTFPVNPEHVVPISVGLESEFWTTKVNIGVSATDNRFAHEFCFKALIEPSHKDAIPFSIGWAGEDDTKRFRLSAGDFAGDEGWEHEVTFWAFENEKPGTIPIALGHADYEEGGWKYRVMENCTDAGTQGWEHDTVFYAYPADTSLVMPVAFGYESEHWCTKVNPDCTSCDDCYYEPCDCFYVFRGPYPGTVPVSIGEAGNEDDHTLRSSVELGEDAGVNGWNHVATFYAFPEPKPGTIPIAVGHADFEEGGWKYKVVCDCEDAGTDGWEHHFVFYAYPQKK